MRHILRLMPLAFVAACASAGNPPPTTSGPSTVFEPTRVGGEGGIEAVMDRTVQSTKFVSSNTIAKPMDAVWGALPDIWASLGLTVDGISTSERRLSTPVLRVRRMLGKVNLSRYVDCGRTTLGPNADSYFVSLKVETVLSGTDGNVLVQSALRATGEGTGNGGTQMRCSSTGMLENKIADLLVARLK